MKKYLTKISIIFSIQSEKNRCIENFYLCLKDNKLTKHYEI